MTPHGFTGHEHVDSMGIIHMNGRIYDAQLGRFLQADPLVEDRTTLNRYTYVHNNPLAYTDPSGYLSRRAFGTILSIIGVTIGGQIGGTLGYIIAAASAFTGTYIATGTLDAAFTAAAFAVISVRIGELIPGPETTTTGGELSVSGVSKTTSQTVNKAASKTLPTADTVADSVGAAANAGGSASPPLVTSTPDTAILQNMTVTLKRKSLVELFSGAFSDLRSAVIAWSGITSSEVINDPTVDSTSRRRAQRQLEEYFGIGPGQTPREALRLVREMDQLARIAQGMLSAGEFFATGGIGGVGLGITRATVARGGGAVIGRVKDLQNLRQGERSLLSRLPDQGTPRANWKQNSGVLRQEMNKGLPIRDASPGDTGGQFLNAERNLLRSHGWTYDPKTSYWMPPNP